MDVASMDAGTWGLMPALPSTAVPGAEPTPVRTRSSHQPKERGDMRVRECLRCFACKVGVTTKHGRGFPRGWHK